MQITAACSSHYRAAVKRSLQVQRGKVIEIKGKKQKTTETTRAYMTPF